MLSLIVATCGHRVEFDGHPDTTPYFHAKVAKLAGRPCPACRQPAAPKSPAQVLAERRERIAAGKPVAIAGGALKDLALTLLPDGTTIHVQRIDGRWVASAWVLGSPARPVEAEAAGAMGVLKKLAIALCRGSGPADEVPQLERKS